MTPNTFTPARAQRPLIAGVLRKTIGASHDARRKTFSAAERNAVRDALADGREVPERAIDHVVERLLTELTW